LLNCLRVEEFAIIEEQEVEFEPGLNIVTGETGAGKSILVSALQLVLGGRGQADLVRSGASQAVVEALFDVHDDELARFRVRSAGIDVEEEIVLRRVNLAHGRTRAYVNGRLTTAAQLRQLAEGLTDISSQHEHHSLANPATHLTYLDAFAGLESERQELQRAWRGLLQAHEAYQKLKKETARRAEREDFMRYQLGEIESVDPQPGEYEKLREEVQRQRHAERLAGATRGAESILYEQDQAICTQLARVVGGLNELVVIDPRLEEIAQQVDSARLELEEAARILGQYGRNVHADTAHLAELEERLASIKRLKRKHGGDLEAVFARRQSLQQQLESMEQVEYHLEEKLEGLDSALKAASHQARLLSERRKKESERLAEAITAELRSLGMGEARVQVEVNPREGQAEGFEVDGAPLCATGVDRVEFLIAPNPGEEPRPLHRVASGGELSRALLALKTVLAGAGPAGTYVFDEVDSGVGGEVAETIGRKLQEIARHHQVICITHLPQIAAFGEAHFKVRKATQDGRTRSSIARLNEPGRIKELGNMLGGRQHGRSTRRAAEEMLTAAHTEPDEEEPS